MSDGDGGYASESFGVTRPAVHLTPPVGWLNDPNGLCWNDGICHAFYQHNPAADVWGPMHWRHATSSDLHTWQDLGIALAPDEHGAIFSGSAVLDTSDTGGFGAGGVAAVAVFTHAGAGGQVQSLASSVDGLGTWEKYDGNPVLVPAAGKTDFRDPKVFWWGPREDGHWVMVLAVGTRVEIYRSADLRQWELSSGFAPELGAPGVLECPDLFEVAVAGTEDTCWFLTVSGIGAGVHGHGGTFAIPGRFDGTAFEPHDRSCPPRLVDHGPDFYAAQTFSESPDGRTIWMAWLSSWHYAMSVPSAGWRGMLSIPRELDAVATHDGIRFRQRPTIELASLRGEGVLRHDGPLGTPVEVRPADGIFAYDLLLKSRNGAGADGIVLEIGDERAKAVTLEVSPRALEVERTSPPGRFVADSFEQTYVVPLDPEAELLTLRIVIDSTSVEVFACGGLTVLSVSYFWDGVPSLRLGCRQDADPVPECHIVLHELRPRSAQT